MLLQTALTGKTVNHIFAVASLEERKKYKKPHTLIPTKAIAAISHGKQQFSFREIKREGKRQKKEGKEMAKEKGVRERERKKVSEGTKNYILMTL